MADTNTTTSTAVPKTKDGLQLYQSMESIVNSNQKTDTDYNGLMQKVRPLAEQYGNAAFEPYAKAYDDKIANDKASYAQYRDQYDSILKKMSPDTVKPAKDNLMLSNIAMIGDAFNNLGDAIGKQSGNYGGRARLKQADYKTQINNDILASRNAFNQLNAAKANQQNIEMQNQLNRLREDKANNDAVGNMEFQKNTARANSINNMFNALFSGEKGNFSSTHGETTQTTYLDPKSIARMNAANKKSSGSGSSSKDKGYLIPNYKRSSMNTGFKDAKKNSGKWKRSYSAEFANVTAGENQITRMYNYLSTRGTWQSYFTRSKKSDGSFEYDPKTQKIKSGTTYIKTPNSTDEMASMINEYYNSIPSSSDKYQKYLDYVNASNKANMTNDVYDRIDSGKQPVNY